ncbi:MAG: hypothetical protein IKY76_06465 [Alistipes sp.]|nr:hypothetical protein [Alistipes sp.]
MKYILYSVSALLMLGALVVDYYDDQQIYALRQAAAAEQQPRRWQSGDTTWYEIDSLPALPSPEEWDSLRMVWDSLHGEWIAPVVAPEEPTPHLPAGYKFDYRLPYWNIYRRSFTRWGITFSTGQPDPFNPYPASNALDASVTSHPLNRPR